MMTARARLRAVTLRLVFLLATLLGTACSEPPDGSTSTALLHEIGESYFDHLVREDLYFAAAVGFKPERLPSIRPEAYRENAEVARRHLARLDAVRPENLEHSDALTLAALRWDLEREIERFELSGDFYFEAMPRSVRTYGLESLFSSFRFKEPADGERYLVYVRDTAEYTNAVHASMRHQAGLGIVMPRAAIDLAIPVWRGFRGKNDESLFHLSEDRVQGLVDGEDLRQRVASAVDEQVRPAIDELIEYMDGDYRSQAPAAVGYAQYPGAERYYLYRIRFGVTLELEPEEIHRQGLERLASLEKEMAEIRRSLGFTGSREEFHESLANDPRFFAKTPEEMERRLQAPLAKIEPLIDQYFLRRPQAPYGLRRLPRNFEASMSFGYYWPPNTNEPKGHYNYNASNLEKRSLIAAADLIYHELVPGHHFQIVLQAENESLPIYRRHAFYLAFAEGWAVYASQLAGEMGLYEDPYSRYGSLSSQAFFATRLVVDTGINHMGWSEEEAFHFMRENTLKEESNIRAEILRYGVSGPAQALGYELGRYKIAELRERARTALGDRFDIRRFHAAVLDDGSLPLAVLEDHIDWFIEQNQ